MREDLLRDYICIKMEEIDVTKILMDIIEDDLDVEKLNDSCSIVSRIAMNEVITEKDIELIYTFFNKYPSYKVFYDPGELIKSNFRYLPNRENLQNLIKNKFKSDNLGFECLCCFPIIDTPVDENYYICFEANELRKEYKEVPAFMKDYSPAKVRIKWEDITSIWDSNSGKGVNLLKEKEPTILEGGLWRDLK